MTKLEIAVHAVGAHKHPTVRGQWVYFDDATRRYWSVSGTDLRALAVYLTPGRRVADSYSRWCADTLATEMPADYEPVQR